MLSTLAVFALTACKAPPAEAPPPATTETEAEPLGEAPASQPASQPREPEPPPPPVEPSPDAPEPKSPYTMAPLPVGAICTYTMKRVSSEQLGGDAYAGREIEVKYVLRSKAADAIVLEAEVEHVKMTGRLEDMRFDLDTSRPADMQRVRGGADAAVEPETVAFFALLGQKVTIHLDERGRFQKLVGGDAVRERFLKMHPPRPRKDPYYIALANLRLSDEGIAERFLPYAVHMFDKGPLEEGRKDREELDVYTPDHRAHAVRARRVAAKDKKILFEARWGFIPTEEKNVIPDNPDARVQAFLGGEGSELVSLEAKNPCFLQGAQIRAYQHTWRGLVKGELVTSERRQLRTSLWRKANSGS